MVNSICFAFKITCFSIAAKIRLIITMSKITFDNEPYGLYSIAEIELYEQDLCLN
jgi:hypothetical protein